MSAPVCVKTVDPAVARRRRAQQKERAHMQEMLDKYDLNKNSSAENKKNKRTPGVVAQVRRRCSRQSTRWFRP